MPSAAVHARSILTSAAISSWHVKHMISLQQVLAALNAAGVEFVLAGAHSIGGWTKQPRATVDVDVVIAPRSHRKAIRAIQVAFPHLTTRDLDLVTRFAEPETKDVVIDLMKPKDRLIRTVFDNSIKIVLVGQPTRIPDLEMAAAMKFAAMVGVYRKISDKEQDGVDFRRIVEANPKLEVDRLARLAELVYAGGGPEVRGLVQAIHEGKRLEF